MKINKVLILTALTIVSIGVSYLNYLRFESFKIQYMTTMDGNNLVDLATRDMNFINSIKTEYPSLGLFTSPLSSIKGNYLLSKDSIELAIKYHKEGMRKHPFLMYSEGQLADIYYKIGDFENFEYYTRRAFNNLPNNPLHFVYLVRLLKGQNKMDSIIYYYNKVEKILGSKDPQVYNIVLASMNLDQDTINKYNGKEIAKKGLKAYPIKLRLMHDYILYGRQNIEKASEIYKTGGEEFKKGNFDKSIEFIGEAIKLHPNKQIYYDNYISANYNVKEYNEIVNIYKQYKEYFSKIQPKIIYYVAESFYNLDDYESSCELLLGLKNSNLLDFNTSNFPYCFNI